MSTTRELGEHVEGYVDDLVRSGRYHSRSDVLREGVRLVEEREARLATLDAALDQGLREAEAGQVRTLDAVERRLIEKWTKAPEIRHP